MIPCWRIGIFLPGGLGCPGGGRATYRRIIGDSDFIHSGDLPLILLIIWPRSDLGRRILPYFSRPEILHRRIIGIAFIGPLIEITVGFILIEISVWLPLGFLGPVNGWVLLILVFPPWLIVGLWKISVPVLRRVGILKSSVFGSSVSYVVWIPYCPGSESGILLLTLPHFRTIYSKRGIGDFSIAWGISLFDSDGLNRFMRSFLIIPLPGACHIIEFVVKRPGVINNSRVIDYSNVVIRPGIIIVYSRTAHISIRYEAPVVIRNPCPVIYI